MTKILTRQFIMRKFPAVAALPQKIDVDARGEFLRFLQKCTRWRLLETQQHRTRFHFRAFAVRSLNLERSSIVRKDGADFESACFFVKYIHGLSR